MNLDIKILENEIISASQLQQLLEKWSSQNDIPISIQYYLNGEKLSKHVFGISGIPESGHLQESTAQEKITPGASPISKNMGDLYHVYKTKNEIVKIPYDKILAFTSFRHYINIITQESNNSDYYHQKITLKKLQEQLPEEFVRCHRTVIVNMEKAVKLTCKDITLSNNLVYPVSESYLSYVRKAFSELLNT